MSSYIKQISATPSLIKGDNYPKMLEDVLILANDPRWDENGVVKEIRKAKTFSEIAKTLGIHLIYEGDDMFSVDADGACASSFFYPLILTIAPYMNDGEIKIRIERRAITIRFRVGKAFIATGKRPHSFEPFE